MKEDKEAPASPTKRLGLMWQLMIAAVAGAAVVAGAKMGFRKLAGWAREGKPEPKGLYETFGDAPLYGALAAAVQADSYERTANKDKENLYTDNRRLQRKIDQLTDETSFSQQITDEKNHKTALPVVRS